MDRKTIYATTNDHDGIEVIDVAARKVTNHFVLDTPTTKYRLNGAVPDPTGKFLYCVTTEINNQPRRPAKRLYRILVPGW